MPRYERPEDIRARLRELDRVAKRAGADPQGPLDTDDVARMFDVMRRLRAAAPTQRR